MDKCHRRKEEMRNYIGRGVKAKGKKYEFGDLMLEERMV